MQVDHSRGQSPMAHQHLDSADIIAGLKKMGGEAMAQGMDADTFFNAGFFSSILIDVSYRWISEWQVFPLFKG